MHAFIQKNGGCVRFDAFAREHLMGEKGFYSTLIDLRRRTPEVPTPSCHDEAYLQAVSFLVSSIVLKRSMKIKNRGDTVSFVEVGGGNGNFKRAFLDHFKFYQQEGVELQLDYVSVEPNPNHREAQAFAGKVVEGTAQKTGLSGNSADFIFDEEVLDCIPFRVLRYDARNQRITQEAYVKTNGNSSLVFAYGDVQRDDAVESYELYLRQNGSKTAEYPYGPDYRAYWDESLRVLKPGGTRFSIDYGEEPTLPGIITNKFLAGHYRKAVENPYSVDLTHQIDFELQKRIALASGFAHVLCDKLIRAIYGTVHKEIIYALGRHLLLALKPE
jgi:SAM-dependent MidA family methyltransferase